MCVSVSVRSTRLARPQRQATDRNDGTTLWLRGGGTCLLFARLSLLTKHRLIYVVVVVVVVVI